MPEAIYSRDFFGYAKQLILLFNKLYFESLSLSLSLIIENILTCIARWAMCFCSVYLGYDSNSTFEQDFQNFLSYINLSVGKRWPILYTGVLGPEKHLY